MEDAGTSEEDDYINSQDSSTPIDHGHLAWKCSIKIKTPAVKASVISLGDVKIHDTIFILPCQQREHEINPESKLLKHPH